MLEEAAGLPAPEYYGNACMLNATIRNGAINLTPTEQKVIDSIKNDPKATRETLKNKTSLSESTNPADWLK